MSSRKRYKKRAAGATTYNNQFSLISRASPLARRATTQTASRWSNDSHGRRRPEGEEIFCDEHGRVKIHFPWAATRTVTSKAPVWYGCRKVGRAVSMAFIAIPRIGHEVIVSFLNGDPDQPIITGRTYHATNTPPYTLQQSNKNQNRARTETHQGEGFNELSFEDQAGKEPNLPACAERLRWLIENDHTRSFATTNT